MANKIKLKAKCLNGHRIWARKDHNGNSITFCQPADCKNEVRINGHKVA